MGKIYVGKPLKTKTRKELVASLKPIHLQHLRADNGDLPENFRPKTLAAAANESLPIFVSEARA
jgi:hypothetical protein